MNIFGAADGPNGDIVWGYGSDYNSNRPNTYVGIINEKCEQLAAPHLGGGDADQGPHSRIIGRSRARSLPSSARLRTASWRR